MVFTQVEVLIPDEDRNEEAGEGSFGWTRNRLVSTDPLTLLPVYNNIYL
jgi:hypothetical protein